MVRSDNWNFRRDGDETSLERIGIRSDTREPCRQSICEGGLGRMKRVMLKYVFVQERRGEEATDTCLCKHEFEQSGLDDNVSYI